MRNLDFIFHNFSSHRLWLYNIGRGIDTEPVTPRFASKSIGCCKKFPGRNAIRGMATLQHWFGELAQEIQERIEQDECENNRRPRQMVVSYTLEVNAEDVASSRSVPLPATTTVERLATDAMDVLKRNVPELSAAGGQSTDGKGVIVPIKFLGLSVGKFEDLDLKPRQTIESMFMNQAKVNAEKSDDVQKNVEPHHSLDADKETPEQSEAQKVSDEKIPAKKSFFRSKMNSTVAANGDALNSPKKGFFHNHRKLSNTSNTSDAPKTSTIINQSDYEIGESSAAPPPATAPPPAAAASPPAAALPPEAAPPPAVYNRSAYAEFQTVPVLPTVYEKCSQCNKNVLVTEMQSHSDAHFAFQLSQEQRVEFRSQMKQRMTPPSSQAKRPKLDRSAAVNNKPAVGALNLINKFLLKSTEIDGNDGAASKCAECGSNIELDRIAEHADYHAAKRLHRELNKSVVKTVSKNSYQISNQRTKTTTTTTANTSVATFFKQSN